MRSLLTIAVAGLALSATASASAQIEGTPPPPPRRWKLESDFGLVNTAGNTSNTTLNAGETASYTNGPVTLAETFAVVYGRTDGKRSAENYNAGVRGDYSVSPAMGLYLQGKYNRDRFAGAQLQTSEDVRVNTETALVAPVSSYLALKVSYVVKFDNLPEPRFEKTDRFLTSALQVVF